PAVAFVDPGFLGEATGTGADDHPFNDVRAGEAFLNQIYAAVTHSPAWPNTVLIFNFDEWGGFFDHVPPRAAPIPDADRAAGNVDGLRGFRTPALLISPFARREHTSHVLYDHTSVLRLIEWRWDLEPLTVRDATAHNLASQLRFERADANAPAYSVPAITGAICPAQPPGLRALLRARASSAGADRLPHGAVRSQRGISPLPADGGDPHVQRRHELRAAVPCQLGYAAPRARAQCRAGRRGAAGDRRHVHQAVGRSHARRRRVLLAELLHPRRVGRTLQRGAVPVP